MTVGASSYARVEGDRYYTPAWVTEALLSVEPISGGVWDPAAGAGDIINALPDDLPRFGSDIAPDADGIKELDFFDVKAGGQWPIILTNPPYGKGSRLAVRFIEHALDLTRPLGGKVIMLLKVGFDSADDRTTITDPITGLTFEVSMYRQYRQVKIEIAAVWGCGAPNSSFIATLLG